MYLRLSHGRLRRGRAAAPPDVFRPGNRNESVTFRPQLSPWAMLGDSPRTWPKGTGWLCRSARQLLRRGLTAIILRLRGFGRRASARRSRFYDAPFHSARDGDDLARHVAGELVRREDD